MSLVDQTSPIEQIMNGPQPITSTTKPSRVPSKILMRKLLVIAGVPIDNLSMEETLDHIEELIELGNQDGRTRQVATVNADFVVKAAEDPELRYILQGADLATPDGMPLVWGARLLGVEIRERVAGADMVPKLAERASKKGLSIYFFGGQEGVAEKAADILKTAYPDLTIAGIASPPFTPLINLDKKYIDDIKAAKPDILLVALGNPKQEKFISMHKHDLGAKVAIGVGGTLDFIAGTQVRAPLWMQNSGTEWIYRMVSDPKRLVKRYAKDLVGFTRFFASQWWHMKSGQADTQPFAEHEVELLNDIAKLSLTGRIDMSNQKSFAALLERTLSQTAQIELDLTEVTFLDSVAIGTLLGFTRVARDRSGDIKLKNVPRPIMKTFELLKLNRFFVITTSADAIPEEKRVIELVNDNLVIPSPKVFDALTAKELLEQTLEKIKPKQTVILDLSDTRLLASAGLAAIVQLNREVKRGRGTFHLANCSKEIMRTLQLVKFDSIYSIIDFDRESPINTL